MDNAALKNSGPGSIADRARAGADVAGDLTDAMLIDSGPSSTADKARMGAAVLSPRISGTPVLTGQDAEEYDGFTVSAEGGSAPYTFALVGTWPEGLSIDADTGEVSGTLAEDGTFSDLSVKVTDADGEEDQLPLFALVIAEAEG